MAPGNICDNCNYKYELHPTNTIVFFFECQPWFSYGQNICPACATSARLFFRESHDEYMEYFIIHDFHFETEDFASEETVTAFERVYHLQELLQIPITARLELEIQNLHTILANVPDDLLLDQFTDPMPPKQRPETWTS